MSFDSKGKLLTKVQVQVDFQAICDKCGQPVIISSILHFADCPQVNIVPCSCLTKETKKHEAVAIMRDMVVDTEHLVGKND